MNFGPLASPAHRSNVLDTCALAVLLFISTGATAQTGMIRLPPPPPPGCAPSECRTQFDTFNEKLCIVKSDWIIEGEVLYVQARPGQVTIEGMIVKRIYNMKGDYMSGDELVYIPDAGCATRIRREWETTNQRIRIYGRFPQTSPRIIVPHYHHIEPLPTPTTDEAEPERLSRVTGDAAP
jgi:hypothetical protein